MSSLQDSARAPRVHGIMRFAVLVSCVIVLAAVDGCHSVSPVEPEPLTLGLYSEPLGMGMPVDADSSDDIIIRHFQYTCSYNPILNVANWVCWNEDSLWYGPSERCDCFGADPLLPAECMPVTNAVYSGSGYDRGHLANSEARTRCDSDNHNTFYYTNIFPQTASLNRQTWYYLERYCDSLSTEAHKELFIMAGGVYHSKKRVNNVVTIPDSCWKVIVVLERGQHAASVNAGTEIIAVMMPNMVYNKDNNDWRMYQTTVKDIEQATGYKLLSAVPANLQLALKN